jgi:modification methylase
LTEHINLILGDCLEELSKIPNNSIDVVITSPPYNKAGYEGFIRKRNDKDSWKQRNVDYGNDPLNDFMVEADYQAQQITLLNLLRDKLTPEGSIFYNHKVRVAKHKASHPIEWILKSNCIFRQQLVWDRSNSPAVAPIRYLPTTELIFWLTKDAVQPNFNRSTDLDFKGEVWRFMAENNPNHPAPFPVALPLNILKNIQGDITVLDPYMGSGTVGVVCKQLGIKFIGIEKDPKYFEIAKNRINERSS